MTDIDVKTWRRHCAVITFTSGWNLYWAHFRTGVLLLSAGKKHIFVFGMTAVGPEKIVYCHYLFVRNPGLLCISTIFRLLKRNIYQIRSSNHIGSSNHFLLPQLSVSLYTGYFTSTRPALSSSFFNLLFNRWLSFNNFSISFWKKNSKRNN